MPATSRPFKGHNHQSILLTSNPHNCLFSVLFHSLFDGFVCYGFASSLSMHMQYTALRFHLAHTQPIFCTAMLTNKSTNGPHNISLQGVVTAVLKPCRQITICATCFNAKKRLIVPTVGPCVSNDSQNKQ